MLIMSPADSYNVRSSLECSMARASFARALADPSLFIGYILTVVPDS